MYNKQLPSSTLILPANTSFSGTWFWTLSVLLTSLSLTLFLWLSADRNVTARQTERFLYQGEQALKLISDRMATYEQVLRGLKGLFVASEEVTRAEFREYFRSLGLEENYPGMLGLGFVVCVPSAELDAHIAAVRAEGFANYQVQPAGTRDIYTAITYIEPFSGPNLNAFGYDMYSEPVRRAALDKAAQTGNATLSAKVALLQDVDREGIPGVLLYLPLYAEEFTGEPENTKTVSGWVYAPFSMDILMEGVELESLQSLELRLYDGESVSEDALLYASNSTVSEIAQYSAVRQLRIGGQPWTVAMRSTAAFDADVSYLLPTLVAGIGTVISGALAVLVWTLSFGRERALKTAATMTAELRGTEFRWKSALAGAGDGVWDWNNQTNEVIYSSRWKSMLLYREDEIKNQFSEWDRLLHPDDKVALMRAVKECLEGTTESLSHEIRMKDANGEWQWILTRGAVVDRNEEGVALRTIGTHTDISRQKRLQDVVAHQASHDELTGLPNRRLLHDRLEHAIALCNRAGRRMALMFVDIDHFKSVNDDHGHDVGDTVLREVATRLRGTLRVSDTLARLGGDEFVVLLSEIRLKEDVEHVAAVMLNAIRPPVTAGDVELHLTLSVGVVIFNPGSDDNVDSLMKKADEALYDVKHNGRNGFRVFSG